MYRATPPLVEIRKNGMPVFISRVSRPRICHVLGLNVITAINDPENLRAGRIPEMRGCDSPPVENYAFGLELKF